MITIIDTHTNQIDTPSISDHNFNFGEHGDKDRMGCDCVHGHGGKLFLEI